MKLSDPNFLFGSATSSHQVEGGNHNDWSQWEHRMAPRLARRASARTNYGQGPSPLWDELREAANSPSNYVSGPAVNHFQLYEKDIRLATKLGLTAYRFSVEWSRVEPQMGQYDEAAISHYVDVARVCRANNQEPFVTLWHFTLPLWAARLGGWESKVVVERFAEFARLMGEALKGTVAHIATMNEPEVYASQGYLIGSWPPAVQSPVRFARVRKNLVKGHIAAFNALKAVDPSFAVGFTTNQINFRATSYFAKALASLLSLQANDYFPQRMQRFSDWIGVQYYFQHSIGPVGPSARSDMGWELRPEGLAAVLTSVARYNLPIYVTESGLADSADLHRASYIGASLDAIAAATAAGADCRGYFHWSLLDNFEWDKGFWPKFGLIQVDRTTMVRTVRPSAHAYAAKITSLRSSGQ